MLSHMTSLRILRLVKTCLMDYEMLHSRIVGYVTKNAIGYYNRNSSRYFDAQKGNENLTNESEVVKEGEAPVPSSSSSPSQKSPNNYTINIFYNDPKKVQEEMSLDKAKEKILRELGGSMKESQYEETLRQVLLLHMLKDRTALERNFKKFLDEDLKDINPTKAALLKEYLAEKSNQHQQQQLQDEEPAPVDHVLNVLRGTTEQNKMAFVREALDLCDKIIDESTRSIEREENVQSDTEFKSDKELKHDVEASAFTEDSYVASQSELDKEAINAQLTQDSSKDETELKPERYNRMMYIQNNLENTSSSNTGRR